MGGYVGGAVGRLYLATAGVQHDGGSYDEHGDSQTCVGGIEADG